MRTVSTGLLGFWLLCLAVLAFHFAVHGQWWPFFVIAAGPSVSLVEVLLGLRAQYTVDHVRGQR